MLQDNNIHKKIPLSIILVEEKLMNKPINLCWNLNNDNDLFFHNMYVYQNMKQKYRSTSKILQNKKKLVKLNEVIQFFKKLKPNYMKNNNKSLTIILYRKLISSRWILVYRAGK